MTTKEALRLNSYAAAAEHRVIDTARTFARQPLPDHVSGELIAPGIVRLSNGVNYFSPATILRAAAQEGEHAPKCPHCEHPQLGGGWADAVAAIIGRLMGQGNGERG